MEKKMIFIAGTMGVGKTTTAQELKKILPNSVLLDGDWCWDMSPFVVNDQTKTMVLDNIAYLLNNFLLCSQFDHVIFCWVLHQREIIDMILKKISKNDFKFYLFALTCEPKTLIQRLNADIQLGKRERDVIDRSLPRLPLYRAINACLLDTTELSAVQTAKEIAERIL